MDSLTIKENISINPKTLLNLNRFKYDFSKANVDNKYMKHLLIYDFIDTNANYLNLMKKSNNDKINEKINRHIKYFN